MARNYAALPHEYLGEMAALNDAEFGRLTRALLQYSMTGEPIALCGNERFYAVRVMNQEDRFQNNYDDQAKVLSERGKAGAQARWGNAKNAKVCPSIPGNAQNGNTETKTDTETKTEAIKSATAPSAGRTPVKEGRAFTAFWENYPNKADRDDAWDAWRTLNPDGETVRAIQAGLEGWKQSGQWLDDGGRFVPAAAKWLSKRRWEAAPPPAAAGKKDVPMGASGKLGEAELEAIQRVLREG